MYYIVNHTEDIIAADDALLAMLSVNTIGELHKKIALNDIAFTTGGDNALEIKTAMHTNAYEMKSHTLNSILGEMTLITLEAQEAVVTTDEPFSIINDEPEESISIIEDDKPFDLMDDETPFIAEESIPETETAEIPETEPEAAIKEERVEEAVDTSPIIINITEISQMIGISTEDYNAFLNEYIDTALTLEEDLKSQKEKQKAHAISTLSHLSNVLHLPVIEEIMTKLENADEATQAKHIQTLYHTLARLTTTISQTETPASLETNDVVTQTRETPATEGFGTIDLSNVKPIHFDFQLEEAANDLSLPVELIEEFVIDFIEQARVETEKMLQAYEKGDLSTIQKIGHLLKGTSSNLRINPLSDTLYEIQFCEESSKLEHLIKEYWAHFLSFEHQINIITK